VLGLETLTPDGEIRRLGAAIPRTAWPSAASVPAHRSCNESDGGGRAWATIATLLATAKMNGVDLHARVTQTLRQIATGWPNSQIAELMPGAHPD
jgi:hypothetical protein